MIYNIPIRKIILFALSIFLATTAMAHAEKILLTKGEMSKIVAQSGITLSILDLEIEQISDKIYYIDEDDGGALIFEDVETNLSINKDFMQDVITMDVAIGGKKLLEVDTKKPTVVTNIDDLALTPLKLNFKFGVNDDIDPSDGLRDLTNDETFGRIYLQGDFKIPNADVNITVN